MNEQRAENGHEQAVVALQNVVKNYHGKVITPVLHGVDLHIHRGDFVALMGPSGSGKSTLLNILGLLDRPTTGAVWVQGRATDSLNDVELTRLRGRTIGFVFQFHHLLPAFSAEENVLLPMAAECGRVEKSMRTRAQSLLHEVGLRHLAQKDVMEMSGGQQQRVAIARSLAQRPALVLADEPTGNLDSHTADEVFALLRRVNRVDGTAVVVVTHDARLAKRCDKIIELVDGCIVS